MIVRQIDHLLIVSSEAEKLFSLLTDTFQLPVAWPMTDYGGFTSGGVAVGNVNLEIISGSQLVPGAAKTRWSGFALEPEPLPTSLGGLGARGIRHGRPAPYRVKQPDGSFSTRWTTVALPDVSSDTVEVFLCQFEDDLPARRRRWQEQLQSRAGGPLSVHSIREIVYGAENAGPMRASWQALLDPLPASIEGVWQLGSGPAIRVQQTENDGILRLVLNVTSLQKARRFLEEKGLLGTQQPSSLTVAGPLLQGLNITLVERS